MRTVGLLVLVAFSGLQCVQDLIVSPPRVKHEFSVSPARDTLPIIGPQDDPIASPFTTALTADGTPVSHALAFTVLQGGSVVQADSAGRLRVVGRGEALLQVRPRNVALPDTLADTVSILGVVPRIGLDPARTVDTLTSIRDTLVLRAAALTLRGDTIPNVAIPWQQTAGQTAVSLVDSATGRVRAEANGTAVFRAFIDLIDTTRVVVVWQRPASIAMSGDTLVLQGSGQTKTATAVVRDARGNAIAGAGVQWSSLNPQVASIDPSTGVVTAVRAGQATIVATASTVTAYGLVTVSATGAAPVNAWVSTGSAGAAQLNDVWGSSASDVFAVGVNPGVVHYDGSSWAAMSGPSASDTLLGVWGASGSDVFAVGRKGKVFHYSGSGAWSAMSGVDASEHLNAVWGSSPRDVFAAGETGTGSAVVYHYDGTAWAKMTVPAGVGALRGLYGFSSSDVHATGAGGVVLHFDGTSWTVTLAARSDREGWRLWGSAPNALFASASTTPARLLVVRRFDGAAWTEASTAVASYQSGLWGASGSEVYLGTDSSGPFVRFDGSAWALMGGARGAPMRGVWGTSDGVVWMVGQGGTAYRGERGATVTVDPATVSFGALGRSRQLTATVRDGAGAVLAGMPVSWSSSVPGSVAVDAAGLASAVATGNATVTATVQGGGTGSATVSVAPIALDLAMSPALGVLASTGATHDLVVTAHDSTGARILGRGPVWTSLIPGVATVAATGDTIAQVTAVGAGQVTIRADLDGLTARAFFTASATGLQPVNVWQRVRPASDSALATAMILGVWAASDSGVVVVGDPSFRFDGAAWHAIAGVQGYAVTGVSAARMWSIGNAGALFGYDGTSWTAVTSGTTNNLWGGWAASDQDVFVGGSNATMLHFNGAAWSPMSVPGPATASLGYGMWGASSSDLWATGGAGALLHYDGSAWSSVAVTGTFSGLWGTGAGDIFAVGSSGAIAHYSGSAWSAMSSPTLENLRSVWGSSATDVYASGTNATILHYDGSAWAVMPTYQATTQYLHHVWGTPRGSVWAVGGGTPPLVLRGHRGGSVTVAPSSAALHALGATLSLVATVKDAGGTALADVPLRWTSTNPTIATVDSLTGLVTAVTNGSVNVRATAAGGAYAVVPVTVQQISKTLSVSPAAAALSGAGTTQTFTVTAQDSLGNSMPSPSLAWTSPNPTVATVSSGGVVTAVGTGQLVVTTTDGGAIGTALVTVGVPAAAPVNLWAARSSGVTGTLQSAWGASPSDIFAVGNGGAIAHYDGASWSAMTSGASVTLFGVWGTAHADVFAVGASGTILHYDGAAWSAMTSGTTQVLYGVWGTSRSDVYAVGGAGTLLHYDGTAWTTLTSGTTAPLRAVWGASPADVFAAGNGGIVLHFDGTNWNPLGSGTTTTLMALWGTSGSDVYALNSGGALFRYNGSGWSALGGNPALSSRLLAGTSGSDLYAVGSGGMRRWDGSTWTAIANGSSGVMYGIWVSGSNHLYAVGSAGTVLQGLRGATVEVAGAAWTATSQGMQQQLTATAKDAAAAAVSGVTFAWTSGKPSVATVDAAGLVTAVDTGSTAIIAVAPGGAADTLNVTLSALGNAVKVTPSGASLSGVGATQTLAAEVRDESGNVVPSPTLAWASLDPAVATVDPASGVVTAVGAGQARIAVTSGSLTGYALVTVTTPGLQPVNLWAPMASGTSEILHDVWGTSPTDIWAVGERTGLALHYDGTQWRTALSGIAGSSSYYGYSVGRAATNDVLIGTDGSGMLARFDGTSWTTLTPPAEYGTGIATALWSASPRETYVGITSAYGSVTGAVARYAQGAWTRVQGPTSVQRLWGAGVGDLFVGGAGSLWRCVSGVCTSTATPSGTNLIRGLWGASASSAFAVGGGAGYAIAWDGANWTPMTGVPSATLNGITGSAANDLYAVGNYGAIARYDGANWTTPASGTEVDLLQAWTAPSGDVFVVGDGGTILRGVRGGTVTVSTPSASAIGIGASRQLTATAYAGATPLPNVPFMWTSSDTLSATVGETTGLVTGIAAGTVTITATAPGGAQGTHVVTISGSAATVATVAISPANPTLTGYGATQQLAATARDAANDVITGVTFTWSSASPSIVTANPSTGLVTAVHTGTASVTATASGGKTGSVTVTVAPGTASAVTVSPAGASLGGVGATQTLTVQVRDPNGDLVASPTASWASLNLNVATVDAATGTVTAVAPGQATITATSGGGTGAALVTVAAAAPAPVNVVIPMSTSTYTYSYGVWGTSATDIWAAWGNGMLHYDGATWSGTATPASASLQAAWGSSPTDVFAVGGNGAVVHYDGSTWTAMASPTTQTLLKVWGASHSDVFAVGYGGTILHYDGTAWSTMPSGTTQTLYAVWGTSRVDVWAAGASGTLLRYDGTNWTAATSGTSQTINDIWGASATDVYAVGSSGTILRWTGGSWTPMTSGTTTSLSDVWGTSSTDIYAVGSVGTLLRYNGSSWGIASAGTAAYLNGAWGAGLGDLYLAIGSVSGGASAVFRGVRGATLDVATGAWGVTTAGNQMQLTATARDAANNVLAGVPLTWTSRNNAIATVSASGLVTAISVGVDTVLVTAPGWLADTVVVTVSLVANTVTVVPPSVTLSAGLTQSLAVQVRDATGNLVVGPTVRYRSLNPAVATVDSISGLVTAVEAGQAVVVATSSGVTGSTLVTVTKASVTPVNLWATAYSQTYGFQGVWGASATNVFAVGSSGTVLNWNGTSWNPMASGTTQQLIDVWGAGPTDVFAVGSGGAAVRYNGTSWAPMTTGTTQSLLGLWGASRSDVFAVGYNGTILRYDGTSWTSMASGTTQALNAVWGTSRTNVFAVGGGGTILHYDGSAWTPMSGGGANYFYDVWGTSPTDVYALSTNSSATLHYNGSAWSALGAGTSGYGLWGTTSSDLWAVYGGGVITHYDGSAWATMTGGTSGTLTEVWTTSVSDVTVVSNGGVILRGIRGATVTLAGGSWTVTPQGNQQQLTATARDAGNAVVAGVPFQWQSTQPAVARVSASGLVTAESIGFTDIIATAPGGLADTITVEVTQVANTVRVTPVGVVLTGAGTTNTLTVEVRDGSGGLVTNPTVAWASADPAVATVSTSGVVTAVAAGQTSISATSGSVTAYATVTVNVTGAAPVNLWTAAPAPPNAYGSLTAIWGSSPTNVYAAYGGNVLYRFDGTAWSTVNLAVVGNAQAIWGSSATDVFTVGYSGAIAHYDGSAWSAMPSGTTQPLRGIWGASPADVFAVGGAGTILHYDGTSWTTMASGTIQELNAVWGTSRSDVYAVGYSGAFLHYNGSAWSAMAGAQSGWYAYGVWGTSGTEVYAVGYQRIYRWDGSTWSDVGASAPNQLMAIRGTSHSDIYAVGYSGTFARYDGTSWTTGSSGSLPWMTAVWSAGAGDLTAVGYTQSPYAAAAVRGVRGATVTVTAAGGWTISAQGAQLQLAAAVKDGANAVLSGVPLTWTSANTGIATVNAAGLVTAVAVGSATVTAAALGGASGQYIVTVSLVANSVTVSPAGAGVSGVGTTQAFTVTVRDGLGNIVPNPTVTWMSLDPAVATVNSATGVATAVSAGQATIAATSGGVTSYALLTVAAAGSTPVNLWALASSGTTSDVNGVWGASATDVFAVTSSGGILHYDGSSWSPMNSGTTNSLYDVWGAAATDVFAVGGSGKILHYNGTAWSSMTSGTSQYLVGVWGSSATDVFAVGNGGAIVHYDGFGWTTMTSGTTQSLQAVWGTSRTDVWAVGYGGTLLHYDGTSWSPTAGYGDWYFYDVQGTSSTNVYAIGGNGFLRWDGAIWTQVSNSPWAQGVWPAASTEVYATQSANVVKYDGSTWSTLNTPRYLSKVWGTSYGAVFAVGSGGTILQGIRSGSVAATAGSWSVTAHGNQLQVTATARDQGSNIVPNPVLAWTSTNPAVARVDGTGLVTAVTTGVADIIVSAMGGLADTVGVTVTLVANQVLLVPFGVTLNGAGASQVISAAVWDASGMPVIGATYAWTSSNPSVATVSGSGSGVVTAVAAGQATITATFNGSISGTTLVTVTAATPAAVNLWAPAVAPAPGSNQQVYGVWGASATEVFAVGTNGTIYRFNGANWGSTSTGGYQDLRAVWGTSGSDVFVVGGGGTILHFDGSSWSPMASGTSAYLYSVWGSSGTDVYAGGDYGTVLHYDGTSWSQVPVGLSGWIARIWGTARSDVWVASGSGVVHFDGTGWLPVSSVTWAYGLWGTSASDVYAASYGILRFDGLAWAMMTGSTGSAEGLWGSSSSEIYAVRGGGEVSSWNGSTWTPFASISDRDLSTVWGTSAGDVYAVGYNWSGLNAGVILRGVRGATVTVSPASPTITGLGTTQQLTATGYAGATPVPGVAFTWTTSNPAVATVSATGLVTAVAAGTATITATAPGGAARGTTVTVSP